jgi:hypothetical protein
MARHPLLPWLLAGGLALHAAACSPWWAHLSVAFGNGDLDYATRRELDGFGGFRIRDAASALDAHLAPGLPLRLAPPLLRNDFFRQRISEGLYPRVVSSGAAHTLRLADRDRFDPSRDTRIADLGAEGIVYLKGILPRLAPGAPREGFAPDAAALGLALSAAVGLGAALALGLRRAFGLEAATLPPLVVPLAALGAGLVASVASWIQRPPGARACAAIGWALLPAAALLAARDRPLRRELRAGCARWRPEAGILAVSLALFVAALAIYPIVGWDGRSIWLFQAKRLHFDGLLTLRAAADPDAQWSHTSYPLLLPAWMAFATSLSPVYNERLIGIAIGLLFSAELWLVWTLARGRLGRGPGAAFTAALGLGLATPTAQGLADGHLTLLLVAQLLAALGGARALCFVLALIASLTKLEGLVLSVGVASILALAGPPVGGARARRFLPWLVFAPAAVHLAWAKASGLRGDFDDVRWSAVPFELPERAAVVIGALPGLLADSPLLVEGAAAAALLAAFRLAGRRRPAGAGGPVLAVAGGPVLAVAGGFAAFAFGAMAVTPRDVAWHVETALGRLLLHPAAILVLAALLGASPARRGARSESGALADSASSSASPDGGIPWEVAREPRCWR